MNTDALSDSAWIIFRIVNTVILFALPFLLLLIANVVFVIELNKRVKNKPTKSAASEKESGNSSSTAASVIQAKRKREADKERNRRDYTKMLISVTFSYLIISVALTSCSTLAIRFRKLNQIDRSHFFIILKDLLQIINSSSNFVFFCLSGNAYRRAFKRAIKNKMKNAT